MSIQQISSNFVVASLSYANQKTNKETIKGENTAPPRSDHDTRNPVQIINTDTIKHVVTSYDQQGKLIIRFMNEHNDMIYQVPTEMVVKMAEIALPVTDENNKK